ncbi:MAG TPA: hypothetical protein VHN81_09295, partial [Edaphobacter sp.]|nr:hypothetical protein [Edaphobacter sp.]
MTFRQAGISGRSQSRIDGIDLLRGLSIFLVLMNHVNMRLLSAHVPHADRSCGTADPSPALRFATSLGMTRSLG